MQGEGIASGPRKRKLVSIIIVASMVMAGLLVVFPLGMQNAAAEWPTPGGGINWSIQELALFSPVVIDLGGNTYLFMDGVRIMPGDRIHIDGDVICLFDPGTYITADGELFIGIDSPGFPMFTTSGPPIPGAWEGIMYNGGSWGEIRNATIEYANVGIWAGNAALWMVSDTTIRYIQNDGISYNFIMGGPGIDNCHIHDCGMAGVRTFDSSLMLGFPIGNRIHDCMFGVYAIGWTGPAFVRNEIYNTTNGIFCDNLDGASVDGNEIYNYTNSGIYLQESFADIRNNNITNDIAWSGGLTHGIHCYSNSHPWIDGNRIYDANGLSGIFLEEHSIPDVFTNVVIDNPGDYGIMLNDFSNVTAENCTIANCSIADWHVDFNSHAVSLNSRSDKVVVIADATADLTMQWFMHTQVVDQFFTPVVGAEVWVNDSFGANILNDITGVDGWVSQNWTVVTEFIETQTARTYYTDHNATAIAGLQQGWAVPEPNMDASREVIIVLGAPSYNIFLNQGWNLLSIPLIQADESIDQVLSSIAGKWDYLRIYETFDPADHWKANATFKPDQLNELKLLNHTIGFWIHITSSSATLTAMGTEPVTTDIPLYAGWNLVGYPCFVQKPISIALGGTGYDRPVEGFDISEPYDIKQLADSYLMKPGEGYWVHVPADTIWTVDNTPPIQDPYSIYGIVYLYDGTSAGGYSPLTSTGASVEVKWWNWTAADWNTISTSTNPFGQYSVDIKYYLDGDVVYVNATFEAPYNNNGYNYTYIDTMLPGIRQDVVCGVPYDIIIIPPAGPIIVGFPFLIDYQILDRDGMLAQGYYTFSDGPMIWTSSDPLFMPPPPVTFDGTSSPTPGQYTEMLTINTPGMGSITVSEGVPFGNLYLTPWYEFYIDPNNTIPGWMKDYDSLMFFAS